LIIPVYIVDPATTIPSWDNSTPITNPFRFSEQLCPRPYS
jgi:hypothetical protein